MTCTQEKRKCEQHRGLKFCSFMSYQKPTSRQPEHVGRQRGRLPRGLPHKTVAYLSNPLINRYLFNHGPKKRQIKYGGLQAIDCSITRQSFSGVTRSCDNPRTWVSNADRAHANHAGTFPIFQGIFLGIG